MKTTEELRKEIEYWEREEYDACLDLSHKIIPLEEQLKVAEKVTCSLKISKFKAN